MVYVDKFVASFEFLTKFNKEYKNSNPDFTQLKATLSTLWQRRDEEIYQNMEDFLKSNAESFCSNIPPEHIINKCHAISQSFHESYINTEYGEVFPLSITIGNVFYKGENIYNVSRTKLKNLIRQGKNMQQDLNVHVWLTFENMMVIDLTILPTLSKKGLLNSSMLNDEKILIWREDIESDFHYEPLLVDNEFMHRIDNPVG